MDWSGETPAAREKRYVRAWVKYLVQQRNEPGWRRGDGGNQRQQEIDWFLDAVYRFRRYAQVPEKKPQVREWLGFRDIRLTPEQDDAFDHWDMEDEDVLVFLQESVTSGYKFTLVYNKQNDSYSASFTGGIGCGANAGYTLSAFSDSWFEAVKLLVFKHSVIADGDWSATALPARQRRG